jgi:hypothetical protein
VCPETERKSQKYIDIVSLAGSMENSVGKAFSFNNISADGHRRMEMTCADGRLRFKTVGRIREDNHFTLNFNYCLI